MRNIMVDVETLGTKGTSVILSIGAVEFDGASLGKTFYARVSIDSCLERGLTVDGSTIEWWMAQADDARKVFDVRGEILASALIDLQNAFDWNNTLVWANGSSFDLPILENAYAACHMRAPWKYYNARDYRTVKGMFPPDFVKSVRVESVVAHDALEDARAQALTLQALLASYGVLGREAA